MLLMGVGAGWGTWERVVAALTTGPAKVLGIGVPEGDLVVIDPRAEWTPTAASLRSLGKNTPLLGRPLVGRVVAAYVDGRLRHELSVALAR